jgi:hypothetical protein
MGAETNRPEHLQGADRQNTPTVGVGRAMRARDVSRPSEREVAEALERLRDAVRSKGQRTSAEGRGGNSRVSS